jgi:malate permease and related proteins
LIKGLGTRDKGLGIRWGGGTITMFLEKMIIEYKLGYVFDTISPVFIVIILGAILQMSGFFKDGFERSLSRLAYWVALPVLLFHSIATSRYGYGQALNIYYVVTATMLTAIVISFILCLILRVARSDAGAFIQGSYRGNLVFIGLPVVIYSITGSAAHAQRVEQIAILSLSMIIPTYNAAAIIILLASKHNFDIKMPFKLLKGLVTNPLVISSLLGILYSVLFADMPLFLERSCRITGRMALPLALLSIGATLVNTRNAADYSLSFAASLIKVAICPIAAFFFARWFGLDNQQTRTALLFAACPAAVSSYVMASQMGSNGRLAAAIVIMSSLISAAAIIVILMII